MAREMTSNMEFFGENNQTPKKVNVSTNETQEIYNLAVYHHLDDKVLEEYDENGVPIE